MKQYQFWFVVGSQFLYGPEVLDTVAARAREMAEKLSAVLPYPLLYKVTAKTNQEIADVVKEANYDDSCAGIITWCFRISDSEAGDKENREHYPGGNGTDRRAGGDVPGGHACAAVERIRTF